jgi:hypothetical protein
MSALLDEFASFWGYDGPPRIQKSANSSDVGDSLVMEAELETGLWRIGYATIGR